MMKCKDNSSTPIDATENPDHLRQLAKPTIQELCDAGYPGLLIFPNDIKQTNDQIGPEHIFTIEGDQLLTGNIMGFIGYKGTKVSIRSRFTDDENDYFLHYMLQKVFSFNLFNLNFTTDEERVFDFLVFMFPHFLNNAFRQGLFKEYRTRQYNNSNVRGRINMERHLRSNLPFMGKVAYDVREFSFDNSITELIRHTIELIKQLPKIGNILSGSHETSDNVKTVIRATPNYLRHNRKKVMDDNRRPLVHPYYYAYRDLQKFCLCILCHEELKYGKDDKEIHGILFDGAWLWEEYLDTILSHKGFKHPRNKAETGRICLFEDGSGWRYPDFWKDDFILDAKYKRFGNKKVSEINRDDLHQVITYMWIQKASHGGFVFPLRSGETVGSSEMLRGYPGTMSLYGVKIDQNCISYSAFCKAMIENEKNLIDKI
ncbi:hypothetical protein NG821_08995 [Prevotella cerevisiae]|jgi:5-methylcytosine-specific restriction endonuclease McrBC regulatory subunit McrC|uniref:Uncharacterized protein n=1 Tax=Segatella cerevisiae TaxID=2053716 RepID=A0ABT1BY10_9BACT|nr:hypothetical protein [Segatella cerevisiae]MCO6025971.1 hypothetical protein [Segatella cerevisiae]HAT61864.1 hypothetical protein [Prevotella sp.]